MTELSIAETTFPRETKPIPRFEMQAGEDPEEFRQRRNRERVVIEQNSMWNLLASTIPQIDKFQPINPDSSLSILDIACGTARETPILIDYFSHGTSNVKLFGIDINQDDIEKAKASFGSPNATFLKADATNLSAIDGLPSKADVVIFRHPDINGRCNYQPNPQVPLENPSNPWHGMFSEAKNAMHDSSILICTFFHEDEYQAAKKLIEQLGLTVAKAKNRQELAGKNKQAIPDPRFAPKDIYYLIAQK